MPDVMRYKGRCQPVWRDLTSRPMSLMVVWFIQTIQTTSHLWWSECLPPSDVISCPDWASALSPPSSCSPWSLSEQLMAAMSVNASAQRSGSKAFFGLRQPPAIPNTQSKKPEVDTKNSPDFMQYKITCVQLDKNSANYLHWRDIQLKQWTGIWKHFSFLSTKYLLCHNFSLLFSEMQLIINYNYI